MKVVVVYYSEVEFAENGRRFGQYIKKGVVAMNKAEDLGSVWKECDLDAAGRSATMTGLQGNTNKSELFLINSTYIPSGDLCANIHSNHVFHDQNFCNVHKIQFNLF